MENKSEPKNGDDENSVKINARAQLIKGFQIVLDDGHSHSVIVDLPPDLGTGLGPTSLEICVMSHAGCYVTICALTAKKMRIPLQGLTVEVEAVETDEAGTITEETFDIEIKADAPADRIQRLHELTVKNCPVDILLKKAGVKIQYNVKTSKE
ncbi:OsmC family protein [Candidatus Bathyarchaeota archaeon]|nr:OsmC family protein [Candidatus Bathyarchaeota archaeon]